MNRKTALRALRRIVGLPKQLYDIQANRIDGEKVRVRLIKKLHSDSRPNKLLLEVCAPTYVEAVQQFQRRFDK